MPKISIILNVEATALSADETDAIMAAAVCLIAERTAKRIEIKSARYQKRMAAEAKRRNKLNEIAAMRLHKAIAKPIAEARPEWITALDNEADARRRNGK